MKPARACPICPECGSKKFERLKDDGVKVQCTSCKKIIPI
jgi:NADH pyrophosphatase NudC (nudix superfamily)